LVKGFFLIFYLINPDTFRIVFVAIIVGTEEEDEYKGTSKKDSLFGSEERVKLFGRSASDYINGLNLKTVKYFKENLFFGFFS
jgi:hypothetical protein